MLSSVMADVVSESELAVKTAVSSDDDNDDDDEAKQRKWSALMAQCK